MRIILLILKRARIFLLFLILEIIAFSLILNQRSFQRATFLSATNTVSGQINQQFNNLSSYLNLKVENENLVRENVRLRNLLDQSRVFQSYGADTIQDSVHQIRYTTVSARVISGTYAKYNNYLTLDKGRKSGIKPNMGVAGPNGVVGIVTNVSQNFASVLPIINPGITISGKFQKSGYFGPLSWDGNSHQEAFVEDIPRYAEIKEGDTIISDSRSRVFPEGLMIGVVAGKTLQTDQNFYRIKVKLSTDFTRLENVYIIKDKLKYELDSLSSAP